MFKGRRRGGGKRNFVGIIDINNVEGRENAMEGERNREKRASA